MKFDHIFCLSFAAAPQIPPPQQQKAPAPPPPSGPCYVAVYDYTAADDDEVSFQEGKDFLFLSIFLLPPPSPSLFTHPSHFSHITHFR